MRNAVTILCVLILAGTAAAQDLTHGTLQTVRGDLLVINSGVALTGTWSCSTSGTTVTEQAGGAAGIALTELTANDIVSLSGYRYVVASVTDDAHFEITPSRVVTTGALRAGCDVAHSAVTAYKVGIGVEATAATLTDGGGTSTPLSLSTSTVGAAALEVGGAYAGGSGCTFSAAGVLQCNGAATIDGAVAANGGFSVDTPAFVVADTTGALTTTGAIAANGGFSVDSPAFVIADTTGAITTTGAAALNGGISVDSPAFTVTDTTGAVSTASTISSGGLNTISIDGNNATTEFIQLYNTNDGATGQTGDTVGIGLYLDASTDSGSTWTKYEGARIELYKYEDFWGSGVGDIDSALRFKLQANGDTSSSITFLPNRNTGAIVIDTGGGGVQAGEWGRFAGSNVVLRKSWTVASGAAEQVSYGYDGIGIEGSSADEDELAILFPTYSDGGAGNQGGESDPTATLLVGRCPTVTVADTGSDSTPATATLDPVAHANCYVYTCNDDDTCDVTMAEATAFEGQRLTITNTAANTLDFADQAGILNINGGAASLATNDTLTLIYAVALWLETSRSDN